MQAPICLFLVVFRNRQFLVSIFQCFFEIFLREIFYVLNAFYWRLHNFQFFENTRFVTYDLNTIDALLSQSLPSYLCFSLKYTNLFKTISLSGCIILAVEGSIKIFSAFSWSKNRTQLKNQRSDGSCF